ncbi:hypothetical protein Tco_0848662, partial [Tanacetum coccineum]
TIVATSTTEAEYVAAANCCGQVLWVQNQLLDYGFNFMNTKIHIDNESTICIVKSLVYHSKTKHIEIQLQATIDTIEYTITEASIRSKLKLADASGITMLPNNEIFEGMGHMGSKSGGWDQFGSNIATAIDFLFPLAEFIMFSKLSL